MTRAAIYARYSSDLQDDRSIEDQAALNARTCQLAGYEIVARFEDRALSGTTTAQRRGLQDLLRRALAGDFSVIVVEHIDRIARNEADWHAIKKQLDYAGVKIHAASGLVGRVEGSVLALVAATQSEAIAIHTHRGMTGAVKEGRNAGGRAYGYRPVKGEPGALEIVADEAAIVRRIFDRFIAGDSPRTIAGALNRERVPAPRKSFWQASTILGSIRRGHGILLNPLYAGRIVWNRVRMVKHPDTGRRLSRVNPESEWIATEVPHLRIVDDATWNAAQARRQARTCTKPRGRIRPRYMLSGLLRCGACGAGMSAHDTDRKGRRTRCTQFSQAQSCSNGRRYYLDDIERAVVNGLKQRLGTRAAIAHFIRAYNDARRRDAHNSINVRARLERELTESQRALDRMIDLHIRERITDDEVAERLPVLRADRDHIRAEIARCEQPPNVVTLHPAAVDDYLRSLDDLAGLIGGDLKAADDGLALALRKLVERVTVMPAPAGTPPTIVVQGRLESLLDLPTFPARSLSGGAMVAGAGLGHFPPTDIPIFSFTALAG